MWGGLQRNFASKDEGSRMQRETKRPVERRQSVDGFVLLTLSHNADSQCDNAFQKYRDSPSLNSCIFFENSHHWQLISQLSSSSWKHGNALTAWCETRNLEISTSAMLEAEMCLLKILLHGSSLRCAPCCWVSATLFLLFRRSALVFDQFNDARNHRLQIVHPRKGISPSHSLPRGDFFAHNRGFNEHLDIMSSPESILHNSLHPLSLPPSRWSKH